MDLFHIKGPVRLAGTVAISGSKNAALPIMAAAILAPGKSIVRGAPHLADISVLAKLLRALGAKVKRNAGTKLQIDASVIDNPTGPYDIVRKMRASICILGPLLARCGSAKVSMPGGCAIGDRPVDIHLRGLRALGAEIHLENGYIVAETPHGLKGKDIFLGGPFGSTVLGTANVLMAATLAKGTTVIESAACEPEIADLANCLNKMGAKIRGIGVDYTIIGDRVEAGTFMVAAAITAGRVELKNCRLDDMMAVVDKLAGIGVFIEPTADGCVVSRDGPLKPADITTQPYPGFPTDLQAQLMATVTAS